MTNYVKLWMEENGLGVCEEFRLSSSSRVFHMDASSCLRDDSCNYYPTILSNLLKGDFFIIKQKTKLTKEQYDFINSFKGVSSFEIEKDGFDSLSLLRLNLNNGEKPNFNLDIIKINFDNLEKNKIYAIKDCDVDYAEAA